jgi:Flp pilus assembly protein TadG
MTRLRSLFRDERGANLIEFAIALPVLVSFIWGILQVGLIFQANAGMQHALGEAARYATIYPTPSDTAIRALMTSKKFGTYNGTLGALQIVDHTNAAGDVDYKTLTLTYNQPTNFLFATGPTVALSKSKRVYLSPDV